MNMRPLLCAAVAAGSWIYTSSNAGAAWSSNWLNVSNSINTVNGQNLMLVAPAGRESSFRLKSP